MRKLDPLEATLHLMLNSDTHKKKTMRQFANTAMPPIIHNQFLLWISDDGLPIGYVSWARLTPSIAEEYTANGIRNMKFDEWTGGEQFWFINFICPYGGALSMVRSIYDALPDVNNAFIRRVKKDGTVRIGRYGRAAFSTTPQEQTPGWADETGPGVH